MSIAASTGANAAQNNYLSHANKEQLKQLKQKRQTGGCDSTCENSIAGLELLDKLSNRLLLNACVNGTRDECKTQIDLDPAAYKFAFDNLGKIVVGRIIGQADTQGSKALASLGQALEKVEIKPLVDAKGNIQGWAVDVGSADPATLKGIFGATVFVGTEIILPVSAIELVPGLGKGLKVVSKAGERLVVKEATGEVVGKLDEVVLKGGIDNLAGTAPNINPGFPGPGRTRNCLNCAITTDATFAGNPAQALPSLKGQPLSILEKEFGGTFQVISDKTAIESALGKLGPGARGIVYGGRGAGSEGHVFNAVVNQNGIVKFFDGQTGKAASFDNYQEFRLLITNSNK